MEPKWRVEASLKGQVEAKWRLEASLKGQVESKWRLEASLNGQVESKLSLECGLEAPSCAWKTSKSVKLNPRSSKLSPS